MRPILFTMADVAIGYALQLARYPGVAAFDAAPDRVKRYFARLAERPAYRRAAAAGGG